MSVLLPTMAEVFISAELAARPATHIDPEIEKRVLHELAALMADAPEQVLPVFVARAMAIVGASSAGLSILDGPDEAAGFHWRCLSGLLSEFEGATTPRDYSPCGVTLDRGEATLSSHPETVYSWISDAGIIVPEVLLIPLHLKSTEPIGTLWVVSEAAGHFNGGHARTLMELSSFVSITLRMLRAEQGKQESLDTQELLAREMGHRLKNLLAVTDSMVRIAAKDSQSKDELVEVLTGRLRALGTAHSLLRRNLEDANTATGITNLQALLGAIFSPHMRGGGHVPAFTLIGPEIPLGEQAVNGLTLIFHELATNAMKYGALSAEQGWIEITWSDDNGMLSLSWAEFGGPEITAPTETGFGSALIRNTVKRQFEGTIAADWQGRALSIALTIPLDHLLT